MPNAQAFMNEMNRKQVSIPAVNNFLRQGCEFEVATQYSQSEVRDRLARIGLGTCANKALNTGNGWNADTHCDGGEHRDQDGTYFHATETSTSPFHATTYREIKAEMERYMAIYQQAAGKLRHSYYGSIHTHTAVAYASFGGGGGSAICLDNLPTMMILQNVGMFFVRFLPVLKWLSMTNINGGRGAMGNTYDTLDGDGLYEWYNGSVRHVDGNIQHTSGSNDYLRSMGRGSMLRVHGSTNTLHFENRMMDSHFSATMMAAWFSLNRAVALFAYDMARQNFNFSPKRNEIDASFQAAAHHRRSWKNVPKPFIVSEWQLMKSYLTKYFKLSNSLDALEVLDKLIDCPIPQYLEENGIGQGYDATIIENHFNVRVREKDDELRKRYIESIKQYLVPMAGNLNDFHTNVAAFLGVQQKQAVSLYQMFKRENVDLEFMAGRLVYMGD